MRTVVDMDDIDQSHMQAPRILPMFSVERTRAFVDAAVAIAMTILIFPLLDSIADLARDGAVTREWLTAHSGQILTFVLSFALIFAFWANHHRLFTYVTTMTGKLLILTAFWTLCIVWLPVSTAIAGIMPDDDALAKLLYIATLMLASLASMLTRLRLWADDSAYAGTPTELIRGMAVDVAMEILFATALAITLLAPVTGYFPLLLLVCTLPLSHALVWMFSRRTPQAQQIRRTTFVPRKDRP